MTERTWKRICYTILALLVPFLVEVGLSLWLDFTARGLWVAVTAFLVIWIWWPKKQSV